jgi:hypothetical protein
MKMVITFLKLNDVYKKYLTGYVTEIIYGEKAKILSIISDSIIQNIPLHILYFTENLMGNKEKVLHYSALIGFEEKAGEFTIADPYGSIKILNEEEFFDAFLLEMNVCRDAKKRNTLSN